MDRRIEKTKNAIKAAYKNLLFQKKDSKITITELANTANIDRKTFYLHYDCVEDILREIIKDNLSELGILLEEQGICRDNFNIKIIIDTMNTCLVKDIDFYKAILYQNDYQLFTTEIKEILSSVLIQDLAQSTNISTNELYIYCKFLVSGITDVYTDWFLHNKSMSLDELGDIISNIILSGTHVISNARGGTVL